MKKTTESKKPLHLRRDTIAVLDHVTLTRTAGGLAPVTGHTACDCSMLCPTTA